MDKTVINKIIELLDDSGHIVITTHHNPDGDAIGSSLALYHYLRKLDHNVSVVVPNEFPDFLKWMNGTGDMVIAEKSSEYKQLLKNAELVFCLDYNALNRVGVLTKPLEESKAPKILIDHHPHPELEQFDYAISTIETSSTAELVYDLMISMSGTAALDKNSAEAIYVGIMTDTGSFSFACNYAGTYSKIAELVKAGINPGQVHRLVYDTYSESRLRLLGYCLSEKLTVLTAFDTAYIALSKEELERFNYQIGDTEGVVNYALSIKGIKVAVLLTERSKKIRLSFRSKGDFAVNDIAREHFAGGGHKNAAGGDSFVSMDETIEKLKSILLKYKDAIQRSTI